MKTWRVNGFKNYLIVYRVIADSLFVEMLVHGARDWRRLLSQRL
jgi:hypothetical protein